MRAPEPSMKPPETMFGLARDVGHCPAQQQCEKRLRRYEHANRPGVGHVFQKIFGHLADEARGFYDRGLIAIEGARPKSQEDVHTDIEFRPAPWASWLIERAVYRSAFAQNGRLT